MATVILLVRQQQLLSCRRHEPWCPAPAASWTCGSSHPCPLCSFYSQLLWNPRNNSTNKNWNKSRSFTGTVPSPKSNSYFQTFVLSVFSVFLVLLRVSFSLPSPVLSELTLCGIRFSGWRFSASISATITFYMPLCISLFLSAPTLAATHSLLLLISFSCLSHLPILIPFFHEPRIIDCLGYHFSTLSCHFRSNSR